MATVEILLATYLGGEFLQDQLDSLAAQTWTDWRLLVRDDGSRDRGPELVARFAARHPDRVVVLPPAAARAGASRNFSTLLEAAGAPYMMLCDQDDVWRPEKIERSLATMRELEARHGADLPLLVHTDLEVVDRRGAPLASSFWRYAGIDPSRTRKLNRLFVDNAVTGCTTLLNRALRDAAVPVPPEALVHDWWLALVAAALGAIAALPQPTVLYRQHGGNAIGAAGRPRPPLAARMRAALRRHGARGLWRSEVAGWGEVRHGLRRREEQVAVLLARHRERLAARDRLAAEVFSHLSRRGPLARRYQLLRRGFFAADLRRNLEYWLAV